jgi:hypothetical protein
MYTRPVLLDIVAGLPVGTGLSIIHVEIKIVRVICSG